MTTHEEVRLTMSLINPTPTQGLQARISSRLEKGRLRIHQSPAFSGITKAYGLTVFGSHEEVVEYLNRTEGNVLSP
jgi:hypothetical protein